MRHRLLYSLFILLALTGCRNRIAPVPAGDASLVVSDRISNQRVNAFAEDGDGHIWIATARGLNKYTVNDYHQYFCADDTLGLPDNQVNSVFYSKKGRLWVGTADGIAIRTDEGRFSRVPVLGDGRNANRFWETSDGRILMSNSATLYLFDEEANRFRPVIRDLNAFSFPYSVMDGNLLWIVSAGGTVLNCYNTDDFSLVASYPTPHLIYHIIDAGNGEYWMSGMGQLSIFDVRNRTWKELPAAIRNEAGLMQGDIDILYPVDASTILLNVIGKGMYCYNRGSERILFQDDAGFPFEVPDSEIRAIFQDSRQNLWFGTSDHGYTVSYHYKDQFNSNKFLTSAFDRKTVTSLCIDNQNRLWITTLQDGVWIYDLEKKTLRSVDVSPLMADNSVGYNRCSRVFCDSQGELWMVFTNKYVVVRTRFDGQHFQILDYAGIINPMAIAEDERGRIWIGGTASSVLCYDKTDRSRKFVDLTEQPTATYVQDLCVTEPGKMVAAARWSRASPTCSCGKSTPIRMK